MKQETQQALQLIEQCLLRSVGDVNYHANWQNALKLVIAELEPSKPEVLVKEEKK